MEIEQVTSQFKKRQDVKILGTSEPTSSVWPSLHSFRNFNIADEKFEHLFAKLYQWLDSLTGESSYKFFHEDSLGWYPYTVIRDLRMVDIVKSISFSSGRYNDAPAFARCEMSAKYPRGSTDGRIVTSGFGRGFGTNVDSVLSKTIGEFLERYFLTLFKKKDLVRSSYSVLRSRVKAIDPTILSHFNDDQKELFPQMIFSNNSIFYWERLTRASTGEEVLVPAQLVYWNYDRADDQPEPQLAETNTNGAGGMFTKEGAILAGIYELIQRDAFLIYWLNELTPPRVDPESVPDEEFQSIYKDSRRYGFNIHCLNTTLDTGVPSFVVVIIDNSSRGPYFVLGGGCQADPIRAIRRAIEEAWSIYYWVRPRPKLLLPDGYCPFRDSRIGQYERLRMCASHEMAQHYNFLIRGKLNHFDEHIFKYPKSFLTERDEFDFLIKQVESLGCGYEVYYFLARHNILRRLGYNSARVIVPNFVRLYLHEHLAPMAARRLRDVPLKIGVKPRKEPYPVPHPFP